MNGAVLCSSIKEIARAAIAWRRGVLNENHVALPTGNTLLRLMAHAKNIVFGEIFLDVKRGAFEWDRWHACLSSRVLRKSSSRNITGAIRTNKWRTVEYRVDHPVWRGKARSARLFAMSIAVYGGDHQIFTGKSVPLPAEGSISLKHRGAENS
jgi:hypothetical protein